MVEQILRHIAFVEDDAAVAFLLKNILEREGYVVHMIADGSELREVMTRFPIALITLDLNLGREDGLVLCRQIRAAYDVPIIMVTGKRDDIDRIVGLEVGADDYIVKPFNFRELLARVRAVLRRFDRGEGISSKDQIKFGDLVLDPDRRELTKSGNKVPLTSAEFNLLLIFVRRPGHVFTRDALMDAMKGEASNAFDRSIDTLVARIRKKLEEDEKNPRYIKTVRGFGYSFM